MCLNGSLLVASSLALSTWHTWVGSVNSTSMLVTRRGTELLIRLGVRPGPEVPWNDLSKGNRQKVVLAQAFLGQLDIIVLDEPFSGLDSEAQVVLDELISEARAQGTSVVVSSHDTAASFSQTYRLVDGRLDEYAQAMPPSRIGGPVRRVELVRRDQGRSVERLTQRADVVRWQTTLRGAGLDTRCLLRRMRRADPGSSGSRLVGSIRRSCKRKRRRVTRCSPCSGTR